MTNDAKTATARDDTPDATDPTTSGGMSMELTREDSDEGIRFFRGLFIGLGISFVLWLVIAAAMLTIFLPLGHYGVLVVRGAEVYEDGSYRLGDETGAIFGSKAWRD